MTKKEENINNEEKTPYLKWRLKEQPTAENVSQLVEKGILTQKEARNIILEETGDIKQSEIDEIRNEVKLLRDLVINQREPVKIIKIIERYKDYYDPFRWFHPYWTYYSTLTSNTTGDNYNLGTITSNGTTSLDGNNSSSEVNY